MPQSIKGDDCLWLCKSFLTQGPDNLFCPKFRSMVSGFFFHIWLRKIRITLLLSCNSLYLCVTIWHLWHFIFESKIRIITVILKAGKLKWAQIYKTEKTQRLISLKHRVFPWESSTYFSNCTLCILNAGLHE